MTLRRKSDGQKHEGHARYPWRLSVCFAVGRRGVPPPPIRPEPLLHPASAHKAILDQG